MSGEHTGTSSSHCAFALAWGKNPYVLFVRFFALLCFKFVPLFNTFECTRTMESTRLTVLME